MESVGGRRLAAEENSENSVPTWGNETDHPPLFRRQNGRIRRGAPKKRCDLVFAGTNNGKRLHGARDSDEERVIRRGAPRDVSVKLEPWAGEWLRRREGNFGALEAKGLETREDKQ